MVISTIVSLIWCPISIDVHRDRGVIHPLWGIGQVVLGCALSLQVRVIPLWSLLLRSEGSKVSISSEDVSEEYFRSYTSKGFLGILLICDRCGVAHDIFGHVLG